MEKYSEKFKKCMDEATKEKQEYKKHPEKYKICDNVDEMMQDILKEKLKMK